MKSKLTMLTMLLGFMIATTHASEASTLRRAHCFRQGTAADMGRKMGDRNARRLLTAVWSKLGRTCDKLDRLAQIISETPLARPYSGGDFAACFYLGYTDALFDELDNTYASCGDKCFNAGSEIGRISAEGYCAASVAVGGLYDPGFIAQPPLPFCGENLVMGCKSEYVYVATTEYAGCSEYTEGSFREIFDNTVRQDCFVPTDVPIRDRSEMILFDLI